jgi:hypothetical protein
METKKKTPQEERKEMIARAVKIGERIIPKFLSQG